MSIQEVLLVSLICALAVVGAASSVPVAAACAVGIWDVGRSLSRRLR